MLGLSLEDIGQALATNGEGLEEMRRLVNRQLQELEMRLTMCGCCRAGYGTCFSTSTEIPCRTPTNS
jgi:hypothetical protein